MTIGFAYKTWEDPGAPILDRTPGTFIAVLDWLLDEEHWDRPFSGENKKVYRAKTGLRRFLQVDDTLTGANAYAARVRGFENMTSVDEGTGDFPRISDAPNSVWHKNFSSNLDNPSHYWAVVYAKGILLVVDVYPNQGQRYKAMYWFGDLAPSLPSYPTLAGIQSAYVTPTTNPHSNHGLSSNRAQFATYPYSPSGSYLDSPATGYSGMAMSAGSTGSRQALFSRFTDGNSTPPVSTPIPVGPCYLHSYANPPSSYVAITHRVPFGVFMGSNPTVPRMTRTCSKTPEVVNTCGMTRSCSRPAPPPPLLSP